MANEKTPDLATALANLGATIVEDSHEGLVVRMNRVDDEALETVKKLTKTAAGARRAIVEHPTSDHPFTLDVGPGWDIGTLSTATEL